MIGRGEVKSIITEAVRTVKEDLDQEMAMWKERATDPIGRTLNAIEKNFTQVLAADTDEMGMRTTPISAYKTAYIMDGKSPDKWVMSLIKTLENYDMVCYDETKGKCVACDGDVSMARLVNRLLTSQYISDTDGVMHVEGKEHCTNESYGQKSTPDEVVAEINNIRSRGKIFAFNMDDYVNEEGDNAGLRGIVYDPQSDVMYCGSITNSGVFREAEIQYDHSLSLDGNLEGLMEVLSQNLMDQGYYPQD